MSVVVVRWECGNRRSLAISKDCGKGGRPDSFIVRSAMRRVDLWRLFALYSPTIPLCSSPIRNLDVTRS
jgi:hypothetical protein